MERDYEFATVVRASDLPDPAEIGRRAAERARAPPQPAQGQEPGVPVVFDPRVAGGIVRHLASAISGPAVARGTTFLKDQLGQRVFASGVTIVDDPLRPHGLRSRAFDAEGIAATRRKLIDQGVLTTWLLDCASARQLGLATTGHAVARGLLAALARALERLDRAGAGNARRADVRHQGRHLTSLRCWAWASTYVTGDYSRGAAGFWIEDGALGWPVSEITIAGNLTEMFQQLTPGDDLEFRYGIDAPTLRIDGMTVAGQ